MNFLPAVLHIFYCNNPIVQCELSEDSLFLSVAQSSHLHSLSPRFHLHFHTLHFNQLCFLALCCAKCCLCHYANHYG